MKKGEVVAAYEYLNVLFYGKSASGKTSIFHVVSRSSATVIGRIEWFPQWRCYVYAPAYQSVLSKGCMDDLSDFLEIANSRKFDKEGPSDGE